MCVRDIESMSRFYSEITFSSYDLSPCKDINFISNQMKMSSACLFSGKGYVPATPIPGTMVVNIGDLMQRWTADGLVATKHRVCIPEIETKKSISRQSMAFFVHPDDDYLIKCLDGSNKYEPITSLDYLNYRFSVSY